MFLNFGKKNSSVKKPTSPTSSPKTLLPPSVNSPGTNASSRSTVQTIAGPLLSSSRFNTILDASTYANVSSPGFTSRVVNCATNGSPSTSFHEKTHQSKYSAVGLFPRVQLGQSILPKLSPHNSQKVRTPVRVRIAPPSLTNRRQNSIGSPTEIIKEKNDTQKLSPLSTLQKSHSGSPSRLNDISSSVIDNLQEASRKRIFSECQDVSQDDSKKRRKKAELPIPNPNDDTYHYRHVRAPAVPSSPPQVDNSSQGKRAREKGSPEEQKRQRRKVCTNTNNAIFSSLSSSRNLLERISAQKRKSADTSRSSSPLTPLSGKPVKENKTGSNAKSTQCNLDNVDKPSGTVNLQDGTPISSKGISKRVGSIVKEVTSTSHEKSPQNATPDYTTKLFRKEVSSHAPRTPTSKTPKQSLWVQPPEADELSSFLNNDSNMHRPERLKSLLARVSGKDNKQETKTAAPAAVSTNTASISLPVTTSTGFKPLSPSGSLSSALTVTVSSTCTIMTSATVTSVNGIPSSESGSSPRPLVSTALASSSLLPNTQPATSTHSTTLESAVKTPATLSSAPQVSSQSLAPGPGASLSTPLLNFSSPAQISATTATATPTGLKDVTQTPSMFSAKSPPKNNEAPQLGAAQPTAAAAKSMFQFGSSTQTPSAVPSLSSTASTTAVPAGGNAALQFGAGTSGLGATPVASFGASPSAAKPSISFGSSGEPKPAFQLGTTSSVVKSTGSETTTAAKPAFSFGATGAPSAALGSHGSVAADTSKPTFQFGSSVPNSTPATATIQQGSTGIANNAASEAPKSAFQFGSGTTATPKPAFQLGNSGGLPAAAAAAAPNPSFQFGSSAPSNNGPTDTQKAAFSFGSSSDASKSNFQFGSNSSSTLQATKSPPSFGSINSLTTPGKSAFQFGGGNGGATAPAPANSAFQFSSNNSSDAAKPAFAFGSSANKPTDLSKPAFGSTVQSPTSAFGQVAPQQTKSAFAFGSAANQSINGTNENKSAFSFSSPTNKPAFSFGASTNSIANGPSTENKSAFSFGASTIPSSNGLSTQNKSTFSFGASTNPSNNGPSDGKSAFSFGTSANQGSSGPTDNKGAFAFGSSGPTFGSATPNSSFGSGPAASAFGAPAPNTQSALPSFGSLSEPKTNGFGSTPSFGSTGNSAFSFSSNNSSSSASSGSAFSFGGAPAAPTNANGAFSFGQKQDQPSAGFSFNATVTAVPNPAQATQAPGLFSIGAGASTTQRRVRDARRRR